MKIDNTPVIGIYEKALPKHTNWLEKLTIAKNIGYDFIEMSIDESDERLSRLNWSKHERKQIINAVYDTGIRIPSICLSGHRRFPLGSMDGDTRHRGFEIMEQAIRLAVDLGIRTIQLAGYDVYYETSTEETQARFIDGMRTAVEMAAKAEVMLAMEIMDYWYMNSITRYLELADKIRSPWLMVYPDIGNLSAWGNDIGLELEKGIDRIVAFHLKEKLSVTDKFPGQFRDVPFGVGCVDFVGFFKHLKRLNYQGSFLIEMWTEKAEYPIAEVINAKDWIIQKMKEGGYLAC